MSATFQTSGGGQIEGRAAQRPGSMREVLPTDAVPVFWFIHHPAKWQLVDGDWLPMLTKMHADPGVNRVDKDGNVDQAELSYRRKGWTIIPWESEPGGYCIAYEGHRGLVHLSKWERPHVFAGTMDVRPDSKGYWSFCRRLLEDGTLRAPDVGFIDLIIADQARKVEDLRAKVITQPATATALTIEEARLEQMHLAKAKLYAEEAPKVRRGRA
jgi:hypothetical protein